MPTAQPPELCLRKRTPGARSSAYVRRPRTIADNISSGRCCSARSTASATAPFTPSGGATRTERRTVVVAAILIIITVIRRPRCRAECSRRRTNAGAADPGAVSAPSWAVPGCQPIAERAGYRWTRISTRSGEATPASRAAASRGGSGAINSDCQQEAARFLRGRSGNRPSDSSTNAAGEPAPHAPGQRERRAEGRLHSSAGGCRSCLRWLCRRLESSRRSRTAALGRVGRRERGRSSAARSRSATRDLAISRFRS